MNVFFAWKKIHLTQKDEIDVVQNQPNGSFIRVDQVSKACPGDFSWMSFWSNLLQKNVCKHKDIRCKDMKRQEKNHYEKGKRIWRVLLKLVVSRVSHHASWEKLLSMDPSNGYHRWLSANLK